jgi:phenylalanyl-tRNA synthetase alpha chain
MESSGSSHFQELRSELIRRIQNCQSTKDLQDIRIEALGKKGIISGVLAGLKDLSPDEKRDTGRLANELKVEIDGLIEETLKKLRLKEINETLNKDPLDASAPGVFFGRGAKHPIRLVLSEAVQILERAGLEACYGPEVEWEDFCFDRLNFKKAHAARDMQATFFAKNTRDSQSLVLRTHTSPVQVRVLMDAKKRNLGLPIRIQAPGRVYRVDDDATHSPMFHQIEGLAVDQHSSMGDLRAVIDFFCRKFFGESTKLRFRPSYFPFTEPSAEVDISCVFCKGRGCKVCKQSGWLEIAGAGMVHPEVFRACDWNPDEVQGWAFGVGVERMAMLKLGVPDLRLFYDNQVSFLRGRPA